MRLLFAGTPSISVPSLRALAAEGWVAAVLTNPDAPTGRGGSREPSEVKRVARELGLPVLEPESLTAIAGEVGRLAADLLVVVAYGRIFRPAFLGLFPRGGLNLHPSLLPRHRGPTPIPATILAGDVEGGVTVQRLAPAVDSGVILGRCVVPLDGTETTRSLSERLAPLGAGLLVDVVRAMEAGDVPETEQNAAEATWCRKLSKTDGEIDWSEDAVTLDRRVRAYDPYPGTYTTWRGKGLRILEATPVPEPTTAGGPGIVLARDKRYGILISTGCGVLGVRRLQLESRKALDWRAFLNGVPGFEGSTLGGSGHATTVDGAPAGKQE